MADEVVGYLAPDGFLPQLQEELGSDAHQTYGKSPKAPEMLLKLGMSLAALDNKDTACATLREVKKRYPKASQAVKAKVTSEQSRLAC